MSLFNDRTKLLVHILQGAVAVAILGLSGVRLFLNDGPMARGYSSFGTPLTAEPTKGAKSLLILSYQVLTEHVRRLRRFQSFKANLILNCLEIVFWAAVAYMTIQSNSARCDGITCTLSWVVVSLAVLLSGLSLFATVISFMDIRNARKHGKPRDFSALEDGYDSQSVYSLQKRQPAARVNSQFER
ncbi:hypothetical protein AK830_g4104 [Neonectria ditissima]|uniref:MARVEL domain-containing protein n=1 Tax=Neonectria ditissima TaxID=78410 RepID=A0A0P7BP30_9HYPO|nr:hypothetical protein AK830_g4104 [Neonectria ditissima]